MWSCVAAPHSGTGKPQLATGHGNKTQVAEDANDGSNRGASLAQVEQNLPLASPPWQAPGTPPPVRFPVAHGTGWLGWLGHESQKRRVFILIDRSLEMMPTNFTAVLESGVPAMLPCWMLEPVSARQLSPHGEIG